MSKTVNSIHPYQIKGIKSSNDLFIILKKINDIIKLDGLKNKSETFIISVRWSLSKNRWVVDNKTKKYRDLEGVSKSEIDNFDFSSEYKILIKSILNELEENKNIEDFLVKYNLKKNENKTLVFEGSLNFSTNVITSNIIFLGLFNHERHKESFIIEDSFEFINNITKHTSIFSNPYIDKKYFFNLSFEDFFNSIKEKYLEINIDGNIRKITVKDFLSKNIEIKIKTISIKNKKYKTNDASFYYKIREGISLNKVLLEEVISYPMCIYITELYGDYVKSTIKSEKEITTLLIREKRKNLLYKLHGSYYYKLHMRKIENKKEKETIKEENYIPILPGVF